MFEYFQIIILNLLERTEFEVNIDFSDHQKFLQAVEKSHAFKDPSEGNLKF